MREGDIESHSGEELLLRSLELLRQARRQLDGFITSRSTPQKIDTSIRPTNEQLATVFAGSSDLASRVKSVENAPEAFVNTLITQYYLRATPRYLRLIRPNNPIEGVPDDGSGEMFYTSWWGQPRLFERKIWIWENMDRDTEMTLRKQTIGYRWRYDHGKDAPSGGGSTYIEMTVNAEGDVELTAPSTPAFPATVEGFSAILEGCFKS